jgi:enoyl-CoA hydratase/carnithine racemase
MGLASEAVPDAEVLPRSLELARTIAQLPPLAMMAAKEVMLAGADASLYTGLLLERRSFELLFASEDQKEGMSAFFEKRRPEFKGR